MISELLKIKLDYYLGNFIDDCKKYNLKYRVLEYNREDDTLTIELEMEV